MKISGLCCMSVYDFWCELAFEFQEADFGRLQTAARSWGCGVLCRAAAQSSNGRNPKAVRWYHHVVPERSSLLGMSQNTLTFSDSYPSCLTFWHLLPPTSADRRLIWPRRARRRPFRSRRMRSSAARRWRRWMSCWPQTNSSLRGPTLKWNVSRGCRSAEAWIWFMSLIWSKEQ